MYLLLLLFCVLQSTFSLNSSITETCLQAYVRDIEIYGFGQGANGVVAKLKEFPHFTAIGWSTNDSAVHWGCGGSLISLKFVLTAAHCSSRFVRGKKVPPNVARMGAIELQFDRDNPFQLLPEKAADFTSKEDTAQEFQISRVITHPEYTSKKRYHDIALMELEQAVQITDYVIPICLWDKKKEIFTKLEAPGFGEVEFAAGTSPDLNKVTLTRSDFKDCKKLYESIEDKKLPNGLIAEQHICASDKTGNEMDTCQGKQRGWLSCKCKRLVLFYFGQFQQLSFNRRQWWRT